MYGNGADSVRRDAMSPEARTQPSHVMIHVTRQAILDARGLVNAYELLYRGGSAMPRMPSMMTSRAPVC